MKKTYLLKIPKEISIIYSKKFNIILIQGPSSQKLLKLYTKIKLNKSDSSLLMGDTFTSTKYIKNIKKKKSLKGTFFSLIKKSIFEVTKKVFIKLRLNGIGYKIDIIKKKGFKLLKLKVGLSHFIYYKIPKNVDINFYGNNKLILFSNNYDLVTSIAAKIRSFKIPEVYKGKGILYENEVVKLKEGKKV